MYGAVIGSIGRFLYKDCEFALLKFRVFTQLEWAKVPVVGVVCARVGEYGNIRRCIECINDGLCERVVRSNHNKCMSACVIRDRVVCIGDMLVVASVEF